MRRDEIDSAELASEIPEGNPDIEFSLGKLTVKGEFFTVFIVGVFGLATVSAACYGLNELAGKVPAIINALENAVGK